MPSQQDFATVRAVCAIKGGENNTIQGVLHFSQVIGLDQLRITGEFQGLPTDRKLAIHVHEYGDLSNGPISTGNRFNPEKQTGNSPKEQMVYVAGEFGNLRVSHDGQAKIDAIDKRLTLFGPSSIIGRSVVVIDEKEEFMRTETEENKSLNSPITNRLAAGVIGICQ